VYRAFCLLFLLNAAPALWACCNFDKDTLAQEGAVFPGILDTLAGKIERMPPEYYLSKLRALEVARETMPPAQYRLQRAQLLARAGELHDAWLNLQASSGFDETSLPAAERIEAAELRAVLGLAQWFTEADSDLALTKAAAAEARSSVNHGLLLRMLNWAIASPTVVNNEMLPDCFGLRLASNKTAIADNDQLDTMKLRESVPLLLELIQKWEFTENVDLLYALSLAMAVDGRQFLAHYARLRIAELLADGKSTRLPLAEGVTDLSPLLYARQMQLGKLVEIRTLDEPQKQQCLQEFTRRRDFARMWSAERARFIASRLDAGRSFDEPDFWQGFIPPVMSEAIVQAPPIDAAPGPTVAPETPAANEPAASGIPRTAMIGAGIGALVVLLFTNVARRRRNQKAAP